MTERVRIDKWLWAARFFKTRGLAASAVNGGKVHVNGERVKPGRLLKVGDELRIRRGTLEMTVVLQRLSARRGPARSAQQLYEETVQSMQLRDRQQQQRRLQPDDAPHPRRRPGKKERRELIHFLGRN